MATFKSYVMGFILSVALTLAAYLAVVYQASQIVWIIIVLAIIQLLVQLIFFLHLGQEKGPRWNLAVFFSTVSIILILVLGSLWIMRHLNYNMTPAQMNTFLLKNEGMMK